MALARLLAASDLTLHAFVESVRAEYLVLAQACPEGAFSATILRVEGREGRR